MTADLVLQILVNFAGLLLLVAIAWFHWGPRRTFRATASGATQEAAIEVRGGYSPDVVVVAAGKPVRLRFTRQETSSCTERVVFDGLELSRSLPTGEEVIIDLPPLDPGEYPFACQMGMIRGKLVARGA
jgi:plastocyanin domain-containing protein